MTTSAPLSHADLTDRLVEQYQQECGESGDVHRDERRKGARVKYECWQLMAEFDGENLPSQREFKHVLFHDISASGISFLAEERPEFDDLIIALGKAPFTFFHVQIRRAVPNPTVCGTLLIGCSFIKRLTE